MRRLLIVGVVGCIGLMGQTIIGPVSATGSIQGTVIDASTNKPIAGAVVRAMGVGSPLFFPSAPTPANGSYQIQNVPAGTFSLCAFVPYQPYFDPCLGGATPLVVTLTSGQQSTGNQIALRQGPGLIGPAVAAPGTGSIQGTVIDATTSKPIDGAIVTAVSATFPVFSQSVSTAEDGSYQINSLPASTFSLCAHVPGDLYPNSCHWGKTPIAVTLTGGQQSAGNQLSVTAGFTLKVRIQDPGQFLNQKTSAGYDPDLVMGVFGTQGLFYPAHKIDQDSSGADYQLAIPLATRVTLSIASKALTLADSTGAALPNNTVQQGLPPSTVSTNIEQFIYTVTGRNP
jgi:hypothetical protein